MSDTHAVGGDDLQGLITRLKTIDVTRIEEDESVKRDALALARKVTATLEGPVNRATDLIFRVYTLQFASSR